MEECVCDFECTYSLDDLSMWEEVYACFIVGRISSGFEWVVIGEYGMRRC